MGTRSDLKTLERAIKQDWQIPEAIMKAVPLTMARILTEGTNREKINAAKVIAALNAQNADPSEKQSGGTTVNVGVNVDNRSDERRARTLAIAERFGTGRVLSGDRAGSDGSDNPETGSVSVIKKVP